jgi:hypothetical protein
MRVMKLDLKFAGIEYGNANVNTQSGVLIGATAPTSQRFVNRPSVGRV